MRSVGDAAQQADDSILLKNLGSPVLPPLKNGQPPVGGTMAPIPAPVPASTAPAARPGPGQQPQTAPRPLYQVQPLPAPGQYRPVTPETTQ
jgi:general secretion pathway protein D